MAPLSRRRLDGGINVDTQRSTRRAVAHTGESTAIVGHEAQKIVGVIVFSDVPEVEEARAVVHSVEVSPGGKGEIGGV